jgi:hypothetical protein
MNKQFQARQKGQEELIEWATKVGIELNNDDIMRWVDGFQYGYEACKQHFEENTEKITVLKVKS